MATDKATHQKHHTVITSDQPVNVVVGDQADDGWFRMFRAVVDQTWAKLPPAAAKVYVVLARFATPVNDWMAWPSVATIAKRAGLAERQVYRALAQLKGLGLIIIRQSGRGRPREGKRSTLYQLLPPTKPDTGDRYNLSSKTGLSCPPRQVIPDTDVTLIRDTEEDLQNSSSNSQSTDRPVESFAADSQDKQVLYDTLTAVGIGQPMLDQLVAKLPAEAVDIVPDLAAKAKERAKRNWRGLLVKLLESEGVQLLAQTQAIKERRQQQVDQVKEAREASEDAANEELARLRAQRG